MFRKMCPRRTWHVMRIHVENIDSTHICKYLRKSCYVCYLPYPPSSIPTPIPTPPTPAPGGMSRAGGCEGGGDAGVGAVVGEGAWEVGEVADIARLA